MTDRAQEPGYVIAVDAGGTSTRVGCFASDGTLLSGATGGSGAAHHDDDAATHLVDTVLAALRAGGLDPARALALTAGVAGVGRPGSNQGGGSAAWAQSFYPLPFLSCPTVFLNDAVTAHRGALLGEPGVIVVAGTGSMVLGIDAQGVEVESGQFEHYAGGARHLVFDVVQQVLRGRAVAADADLVARVLQHWDVEDPSQLRAALLRQADLDRNEVKRRYGDVAPTVTALAGSSPLADRALTSLTDRTAEGVLVLAPAVGPAPVRVAVTGSLALDPAFTARLERSLEMDGTSKAVLVPAALGPLGGAALIAWHHAGTGTPGPDVVDRLRESAAPLRG